MTEKQQWERSGGSFAAEDLLGFRVVKDIELSPDGRWLVYVLEVVDGDRLAIAGKSYGGATHRLAETGRPRQRVDYHGRIAGFIMRHGACTR
jgi:hypothetical protein